MRNRILSRQPLVNSFGPDESLTRCIGEALRGSVLVIEAGRITRTSQDARVAALAFLEAAAARDIAIIEVAAMPELRESRRGVLSLRSFDSGGRLVMVGGPPDELDRYFRGEEARWRKVIEDAGIRNE